jgi:hypothetical protein
MIKLTEKQRQELKSGNMHVRVLDPATRTEYKASVHQLERFWGRIAQAKPDFSRESERRRTKGRGRDEPGTDSPGPQSGSR